MAAGLGQVRTIEIRDIIARIAKLHLSVVCLIIQKDTTLATFSTSRTWSDTNGADLRRKGRIPTRRVGKSRLRVANNLYSLIISVLP